MHLELIRTKDRQFPELPEPLAYTTARIWHCRYQTLAPLATFVNLRGLTIATYPDSTFDLLSKLTRLENLSVQHMPRVSDLTPLSALTNLRRLELATLPSWDASGKVTQVQSLAPLADLPKHLSIIRRYCLACVGHLPASQPPVQLHTVRRCVTPLAGWFCPCSVPALAP